jgi:fucose 4-O-acetylase-like acetyltransferase
MEQIAQLPEKKKRIEYIDAMRGFTMILVVYSHIIFFGYGDDSITSFNSFFVNFRMPLFFFISGWVLYKVGRIWDWNFIKDFLPKKFMVQIIPTVFFFLIFIYFFRDMHITMEALGPSKSGYWFTLTLFEFFLIYAATMFLNPFKNQGFKEDLVVIVVASVVYFFSSFREHSNPVVADVYHYLGINYLRYYVFFCLGTFIKKYYEGFCQLMDNKYVMALVLMSLLGMIMFSGPLLYHLHAITFVFVVYGTLGIMVVLTFFRKHENRVSSQTVLGRYLQFIGRRTLDVYLLHYLFLPRHLEMVGAFFKENPNPVLEFFVSVFLACLVIIVCLTVSEVLRMSPFLEHRLFGVKSQKTK